MKQIMVIFYFLIFLKALPKDEIKKSTINMIKENCEVIKESVFQHFENKETIQQGSHFKAWFHGRKQEEILYSVQKENNYSFYQEVRNLMAVVNKDKNGMGTFFPQCQCHYVIKKTFWGNDSVVKFYLITKNYKKTHFPITRKFLIYTKFDIRNYYFQRFVNLYKNLFRLKFNTLLIRLEDFFLDPDYGLILDPVIVMRFNQESNDGYQQSGPILLMLRESKRLDINFHLAQIFKDDLKQQKEINQYIIEEQDRYNFLLIMSEFLAYDLKVIFKRETHSKELSCLEENYSCMMYIREIANGYMSRSMISDEEKSLVYTYFRILSYDSKYVANFAELVALFDHSNEITKNISKNCSPTDLYIKDEETSKYNSNLLSTIGDLDLVNNKCSGFNKTLCIDAQFYKFQIDSQHYRSLKKWKEIKDRLAQLTNYFFERKKHKELLRTKSYNPINYVCLINNNSLLFQSTQRITNSFMKSQKVQQLNFMEKMSNFYKLVTLVEDFQEKGFYFLNLTPEKIFYFQEMGKTRMSFDFETEFNMLKNRGNEKQFLADFCKNNKSLKKLEQPIEVEQFCQSPYELTQDHYQKYEVFYLGKIFTQLLSIDKETVQNKMNQEDLRKIFQEVKYEKIFLIQILLERTMGLLDNRFNIQELKKHIEKFFN